jgi:phenylacetate-CoA ligase
MQAEIRDRLVGNILFPFSNTLLNRKGILSLYRKLLGSERCSEEMLKERQFRKILRVLEHAYQWVPYYRKKFRELGMVPDDIRSLEDMRHISPLTRQDVINHRVDLVDVRCSSSLLKADKTLRGPGEPIPMALFRKHRLVRNTSSGSTGAPTVFYEDGSTTARNWAYELQVKNWYGVKPGEKEARMARLSTAYLPSDRRLRLRSMLWNQLILPGINLSDLDYGHCIRELADFRPKILWGFTSALSGLAEYMKKNNLTGQLPPLSLVITWAAPLYEHEEDLMSEVFRCPVTNIYGIRETGHIAARCPAGSFHINDEAIYAETYNCDNEIEGGEILVTELDASPMPFIRYKTGDIARISAGKCSCGRSLRIIDRLLGRTGEIFFARDGRMISPNFWCRTFMDTKLAGSVRRFQVVYKKDDMMSIRIVRNNDYSKETEEFLKSYLKDNFPYDMKISFDYVENIEPQISGKYQMVVNETRLG